MKKLIGVMLGVLILCFAPVVNAAKSNDTKARHFSMVELKDKLSKLILDKYPDSHIDAGDDYISACNAVFNEDTAKKQKPCLDSQVRPLPDSDDFVFSLFRRADNTHYQQIQYRSESSLNSITKVKNRYDIDIVPKAWETSPDDVPLMSWTYDAISQLNFLGVRAEVLWSQMGTSKPITRYEFAVATARLLNKKSERAKDSPKVKELIAKLALEFEPELLKLNYPLDHNGFIKELADVGIIWQPRYMYFQFNLSYGKKFDRKLCQKMEHVIKKYTATWLKSNSSSNAAAAQK